MTVLETILKDIQNVKVIDKSIDYSQYIPLDLSIKNENFTKHTIDNAADFEKYIEKYFRAFGSIRLKREEQRAEGEKVGGQ